METSDSERSGMSRRTILRTAAWSVPAVGSVIAAPAMTASVTDACLDFSGDGQLVAQNGQFALSSAAFAAVSTWLTANSLSWPIPSSVVSVRVESDYIGTLNGAPVDSFVASGTSTGSVRVWEDGSVPVQSALFDNAIQEAAHNLFVHTQDPAFSGVEWNVSGATRTLVTLSFAYSADCWLIATYASGGAD